MQFFCKKKLKSEIFNNKKSFNITGIFTEKLKNPVFRQAGMGEESGKRGGLGQFADLSEEFGKKEGVVFLRGVETPMHFMVFTSELPVWLVESLKGLPPVAHTSYQF